MQTIKPSRNNLFCKKQEAEAVTRSGIILPESSQEETQFADVVAVGESVTFTKGDVIVYKEYTTTDIKLDGQDYFLINQEDVLGTIVGA